MMNWLVPKAYAAYNFNFLTIRQNQMSISSLVTMVIGWMAFVAGVLAVVYLIYSGILYLTAGGNPDQAKKGQQGIINAIIGLVIIALAFSIAWGVGNLIS